ncbi:hypothetical protein SETIT_7G156400v2 [Setaria italica]|uniref:F-box domain-containing protein n=1 Tax=Setaria italica TaxID=4555 RepID=K3YBU7_SETIT|nr:hypothetical protein SETIT_7G156400v2 [Setaria italica]
MASAPAGNKRGRPLAVANDDDGVLPTDLLCEVLLRVPADALCRLRLVCRSWRSLTSEPHFAAAHASRRPLVAGLHNRSGEIRIMDLSGGVVKRIRVREDGAPAPELAARHGLRLIIIQKARVRVLNTATGASAVLPSDVPVGYRFPNGPPGPGTK